MIEDPYDRLNRLEEGIVKLTLIMEYQKDQIRWLLATIEGYETSLETQTKLIDIHNIRLGKLEKEQRDVKTTSRTIKDSR